MTAFFQNAMDAIALGSLFALTALGIGLIFGVMRLINFAHGDFIMIGGYALIVPSSAVTATLFIGAWPAPFLVGAIRPSSIGSGVSGKTVMLSGCRKEATIS